MLGSSAWRRDHGSSSKKGLAGSLLVHGAVGVAFVLSSMWAVDAPPLIPADASPKVFNLPGPVTPRPEDKVIAIADPKSAITKTLPKPSDAPVAPMAIPEGGSGSEVLIWTPPQPDFGYGKSAPGYVSQARTYVDLPIPLITMPGVEVGPILSKFDGVLFIETSKKFSGLGPGRPVILTTEVAVDVDGKPTACLIIDGKVSDEMDLLACRMLMASSYLPGKNRSGVAQFGFARDTLSWDGQKFRLVMGEREALLNDSGQVQVIDRSLLEGEGEGETIQAIDPAR